MSDMKHHGTMTVDDNNDGQKGSCSILMKPGMQITALPFSRELPSWNMLDSYSLVFLHLF